MNLSELMKSARARHGWNIREAASRLGTGAGHLCQIERGQHFNVTAKTIYKASVTYGIDKSRLLNAAIQSIQEYEFPTKDQP